MKTAGWIFLILGIVSFLGAAIGSSSVVGPCFWIALGAFLIYKGNEKEKEKAIENQNKRAAVTPDIPATQLATDRATQLDAPIDVTEPLTSNQKECAFCLTMFFHLLRTVSHTLVHLQHYIQNPNNHLVEDILRKCILHI